MNWLWAALATWAFILLTCAAIIAWDEARYRWRQHRRRNVQTVDFTRRKVG